MNIIIHPKGWGTASIDDIHVILSSVQCVFLSCFGQSINTSPVNVIHTDGVPYIKRSEHTIFLGTSDLYWCQYAYQFAHEYCHFQILNEVPKSIRWFEEALCELASYYFLPLISLSWRVSPPYPSWLDYADKFTQYVLNDKKKATSFDLDFSSHPSTLSYFSEHEYDRNKNAYIAIKLLPIFADNSLLWSTIPLIGNIPSDLSFPDALKFWHDHSPVLHQKSIQRIIETFSLDLVLQ